MEVKQNYTCPQTEEVRMVAECSIASPNKLPGTEWLDMEDW